MYRKDRRVIVRDMTPKEMLDGLLVAYREAEEIPSDESMDGDEVEWFGKYLTDIFQLWEGNITREEFVLNWGDNVWSKEI